ncbi:MAG: hypothetical protein IKP02_09165 [Paludibacteraceae bacterium]|nr:hypothetical protein [Paludibacteraceae bacterium]
MKTICKNLRALILMACVLLCACHTTRHTVSVVDAEQDTQSTHHEQTTTQRLDSLISTLSASADSITIELYGDAPAPVADSLNTVAPSDQASSVTAKPQPKKRITIHAPRINKEERHGSDVRQQTNVADSTRSNSQSHTSTDDSKEVIGGAEPPNLTAVFIVLGLGITLLIIGAIFGYLWLHKKHII